MADYARMRMPLEVVYRNFDVYVKQSAAHGDSQPKRSRGILHVREESGKPETAFLEWMPIRQPPSEAELAAGKNESGESTNDLDRLAAVMKIDLFDIRSFRESRPAHGRITITFSLRDGSGKPPMELPTDSYQQLVGVLQDRLDIERSRSDPLICVVSDPRKKTPFNELLDAASLSNPADLFKRFTRNPVTSTLTLTSKVTNILNDAVESLVQNENPEEKDFEQINAAFSVFRMREEQGFEVVSLHTIKLPPRPEVQRRAPLSPSEWADFMDEDGRLARVSQLKEIIFRGGVDPTIRKEVWKFLLGYHAFDATHAERRARDDELKKSYYLMKTQWQTITPDQEKRWTLIRERKDLVEKDVQRTDRTHAYFSGDNPHLTVLNDILMTYCMWNFDLGYVQGMSDLLSPLLTVLDDEVDAFWCFDGYMNVMCDTFDMDKMKENLKQMGALLKIVDPKLHRYLERNDSSQLLFCFRWLLIHFKREFCFDDLLRLWEVLWSGLRCRNFHMLIALAILETERNRLMENRFGLNEILKHVNDLAMHIPLETTLQKAEGMYLQLATVPDLPDEVREVLGLPTHSGIRSPSPRPDSFSGGGARTTSAMNLNSSASGTGNGGSSSINRSASGRSLTTPVSIGDDSACNTRPAASGNGARTANVRQPSSTAGREVELGHILLT